MMQLHLVLLIIAFILFVLGGLNLPATRINLVAFGLAFLTLALWIH